MDAVRVYPSQGGEQLVHDDAVRVGSFEEEVLNSHFPKNRGAAVLGGTEAYVPEKQRRHDSNSWPFDESTVERRAALSADRVDDVAEGLQRVADEVAVQLRLESVVQAMLQREYPAVSKVDFGGRFFDEHHLVVLDVLTKVHRCLFHPARQILVEA